jgi:putative hydrolase of the HAD superfamily
VIFDLFHTLACVPTPVSQGELPVHEILGVSSSEFQRCYYDEDIIGRALGRVKDSVEAMRLVARMLDPAVADDRVLAAVESRRRRLETGLVCIDDAMLQALDRLRAAGIRTGLVSDAGADDVECWHRSPLTSRLDTVVFSFEVGVRKPDARIYRYALEALGVLPADTIFVGDGGSDEHNGARAVGMDTVLVTRFLMRWWPDKVAGRRPHADWEFEDVPAFVDALGL